MKRDARFVRSVINSACSGMFSDELDKMGFRNQVISGLVMNDPYGRIYGKVRTVRLETRDTDDENIRTGLGFLGSMKKGEVLCVEGSKDFAYFGELMTRLSLRQKIAGVVIGGLTRDSFYTQTVNALTVFSEGYSPKDIKGRGKVEATDVEITIGGLKIRPGDWLFGDKDGVVVVPYEEKERLEDRIRNIMVNEGNIKKDIKRGLSVTGILRKYKEF